MKPNKPLPHLTIRSGPWAGTMIRFATVAQLRAVQRQAHGSRCTSENILDAALRISLNAPQPKQS